MRCIRLFRLVRGILVTATSSLLAAEQTPVGVAVRGHHPRIPDSPDGLRQPEDRVLWRRQPAQGPRLAIGADEAAGKAVPRSW